MLLDAAGRHPHLAALVNKWLRFWLLAALVGALSLADAVLIEFGPRHTWWGGLVAGLIVGLATRVPRPFR